MKMHNPPHPGEVRASISPEMAVRLSIGFDTSAESWLNQQVQYVYGMRKRNGKCST
jgi:plasmid maintenance system antidote protein VapI